MLELRKSSKTSMRILLSHKCSTLMCVTTCLLQNVPLPPKQSYGRRIARSLQRNFTWDTHGWFALFFPSTAFMASARSFNTLNGIAKALISKLIREAVCWLRPQKRTGEGPVQSKKPSSSTTNQKTARTNHQNNTKTNRNQPTKEEWLATSSLADSCKRWQPCVITSWFGRKHRQKGENTNINKAIPARGDRSNKADCGNQGSPSQDPEITESSRSGITFTRALRSKHRQRRVATRVVKTNKRWNRRWDMIYGEKWQQ